jgi:putative restriction endonuclease
MAKLEVPILNHTDLRYLLIDNLNLYSDNSYFIEWNNPYNFSINKESIYIYVKNSHSSWNWRWNEDESRIQIWKSENFLEALNSWKLVFFLWYSDEYGVFTAWNPYKFKDRINQRQTVSVYSRFSIYKKAKEQGISIYIDWNWQKIISFRPEYIWLYLENYKEMHQSNEESLLELISKSDWIDYTSDSWEEVNINNEHFYLTKSRAIRDPNFRKKVYNAYNDRCAITWIQLNLVEAAHIVPHSHEKWTDDITNWICLSALYHLAFDNWLIYIDNDYNIKINDKKLIYLEKIWKDWWFKKFQEIMYDKIVLPKIQSYYPSKSFINLANKIRWINCD